MATDGDGFVSCVADGAPSVMVKVSPDSAICVQSLSSIGTIEHPRLSPRR